MKNQIGSFFAKFSHWSFTYWFLKKDIYMISQGGNGRNSSKWTGPIVGLSKFWSKSFEKYFQMDNFIERRGYRNHVLQQIAATLFFPCWFLWPEVHAGPPQGLKIRRGSKYCGRHNMSPWLTPLTVGF